MTKYVAQVKKVLKDIKVTESIFKGMYCKKYYLKIGFWLWLWANPSFRYLWIMSRHLATTTSTCRQVKNSLSHQVAIGFSF